MYLYQYVELLLMPLPIAIFLVVSVVILPISKNKLRAIAALALTIILTSSLPVFSNWLIQTLENRYVASHIAAFDASSKNNLTTNTITPTHIILLAGGLALKTKEVNRYSVGVSGDRLMLAVYLLDKYPLAKLLVSGTISDEHIAETEASLYLLEELGIERNRIIVETTSTTTYENAVETAKLLSNTDTPVLLVTSAYHMPRAMRVFKAFGINAVAAPADYRGRYLDYKHPSSWLPGAASLKITQIALHEYYGMVWYKFKRYY